MDGGYTLKIIYIEWIDAVADSGWEEYDKSDDVHHCKSIGYLVKETKEGICLASTISDKESNARITIPKAWIRKRRTVVISGEKRQKK